MTVTEILSRLEASPPILTGGRALQDWLARETNLGEARAKAALREYRRFLALALSAPDQPRVPGPMIAQLWQLLRGDSAAYAAFLAEAGQGARLATRPVEWRSQARAAYTETRRAYEAAFGPAPRRWWPTRPKPPGTDSYRLGLASLSLPLQIAGITAVFLTVKGSELWLWVLGALWVAAIAALAIALWREARAPRGFSVYVKHQIILGET